MSSSASGQAKRQSLFSDFLLELKKKVSRISDFDWLQVPSLIVMGIPARASVSQIRLNSLHQKESTLSTPSTAYCPYSTFVMALLYSTRS